MAILNLCSRLLSSYAKYRMPNAIHHIFKGNVKPQSLMGTYRPLSSSVDAARQQVCCGHYGLSMTTMDAAKFAVEHHNHQNGTQLTLVGLVGMGYRNPCITNHVFSAILMLKVSDQTGKLEYVRTELSVRRELLQSSPLEYMSYSEISEYSNSDG